MQAALRDVREKRLLIGEQDRWIMDLVTPYLGKRLLEVGCGWGNVLQLIDHSVDEIVAIDIDRESVDNVRQAYLDNPAVEAWQGDICDSETVEAIGSAFDTVLSVNVLEHIEDDVLALTHMKKMLAPGGRLIVIVPAHLQLYTGMDQAIGHYRRYSKLDLADKLESVGCQVERLTYINGLGALGWYVTGRFLRKTTPPSDQLELMNKIVPILKRLEAMVEPPLGVSLLAVAR
jgi:SAM-dependent methyltransferase